jgi:hypothetical protein
MTFTKRKKRSGGGSYEIKDDSTSSYEINESSYETKDEFIDEMIIHLNIAYKNQPFGIEDTMKYFLQPDVLMMVFTQNEDIMSMLKIGNNYEPNKDFIYAKQLTNLVWKRLINNYLFVNNSGKAVEPEILIGGIWNNKSFQSLLNQIEKKLKNNKLRKENNPLEKRQKYNKNKMKTKKEKKINHKNTNPIENNLFQKVIKKTRKLFQKHGRLYNAKKTWKGKIKNKLRPYFFFENESPIRKLGSNNTPYYDTNIPKWYQNQPNWETNEKIHITT